MSDQHAVALRIFVWNTIDRDNAGDNRRTHTDRHDREQNNDIQQFLLLFFSFPDPAPLLQICQQHENQRNKYPNVCDRYAIEKCLQNDSQ